jgi:hypothetical protein
MSGPPTVEATRYVAPLREGGSLPALIEADDDGLYVLKFRGAGQGPKSLIAELVAGEIGRALGLPVPVIAFVELDPALGRAEPDPEIQDLLRASPGLNLGLDYLPGSLAYDPAAERPVDAALAADIVWFDALMTNVDRSARNPNLLVWHERLWLIDHGAALYAHHHDWRLTDAWSRPFPIGRDHVLLPLAGPISDAHERLSARLDRTVIEAVVGLIPDLWLADHAAEAAPAERRSAYAEHLVRRLASGAFVEEADDARAA